MTTYGYQVTSDDDEFVRTVELATRLTVEAGTPGGEPVDMIPLREANASQYSQFMMIMR